jgi:oxygen-independent coproporphyrinogen III oxidase
MNTDLVTRYEIKVPRYTSYPTAPHFSAAVDESIFRGWLGAQDPATRLSLYFHIPFCAAMCWYCGCYTKIVNRYEPVAEYLTALLREIDLAADALPGRFTANHLHWGGGSPTMLTGEDWLRIVDHLRTRFDFDDDAEIAVEADPRTATEDYISALAAAGVNRVSIGVQDFELDVQQAVNRVQPFEVTKRVIDWLRGYGIDRINLDLMYGLPLQTRERVIAMADKALTLRPDRIALFGYAHVPWMKPHQRLIPEKSLPDTAARWEQFNAVSERLVEAGYVAIGLDHFALPDDQLCVAQMEGRLHRNFQGYTVDTASALIGFGASAISSLSQGYAQNASPIGAYRKSAMAGHLPIVRGVAIDGEDRLRGTVIERLMCDLNVDLDALCISHGKPDDHFRDEIKTLNPLQADGVIRIDGGKISVTDEGRPLVRLVAAAFDRHLDKGEARYSKAV